MIENAIIKKKYRANLICLIVGVLLAVITVVLGVVKLNVSKKDAEASTPFADAYNNETLDADDMVYIDLSDELYEIGHYDESERYYFGFDEYDDMYIIRCSSDKEKEIAKEIEEKGTSHIVGTVLKLKEEVLETALEVFNEAQSSPENEMTQEFFDTYFQGVGLFVGGSTGSATGIVVLAVFTGLGAFIALLSGLLGVVKFKRGLKGLTDVDKDRISNELANPATEYIKKCNIFLTPNYLVYADSGFEAIPYEQMNWAYQFTQRYNFVPILTNIHIWLKDGKEKQVGNMSLNVVKKDDIIKQVFEGIYKHNPNVQFGYTEELKQQFGKRK
ncbi:MAG: hypothetical protein K6G72_09425 [Lachnospiraceae bacterium]|nr:hypothetical protein [Lachnospiraceae bacterium]